MVKIVGRTDEERELEQKVRGLYDITLSLVGKKEKVEFVVDLGGIIFVLSNVSPHIIDISAFVDRKLIKAKCSTSYDLALQLAQAYEKETGEEWALKKEYDER